MTRRPARASRRAGGRVAPPATVDGEQAAALGRLRAAFGPVVVVEVRAHDHEPGQAPTPAPGSLLDARGGQWP